MTAQQILKMIEKIDPNHMVSLNAIDVCVEQYLQKNDKLEIRRLTHSDSSSDCVYIATDKCGSKFQVLIPQYTRSRDALKQIRPANYKPYNILNDFIGCKKNKNHWYFELQKINDDGTMFGGINNISFEGEDLPTEELAELHAIIQAIEYERNKK